jgi:hypothetical protein
LAALVVLVLFGAYQFMSVFRKKGRSSVKSYASTAQKVSNGTSSSGDVDFEWIPKEHLQSSKLLILFVQHFLIQP